MAYLPLLRSKRLITFILSISLLVVPYWVFIGMSPILFMQDMGVELQEFGFYQGSLSIVFSTFSVLSPKLLEKFGPRRCLRFGMTMCALTSVMVIAIAVLGVHSPILITGAMLFLAIGVVFPMNILFPVSLEVIEDTKSRTSALVTSIRLILTAITLEVVSFFYQGKFLPIGIAIFASLALSLWLIRRILRKAWMKWPSGSHLGQVH